MTIKMAWRNLWRSKRRTLITAFTVAGGVFFFVAFTAVGENAYYNIINTSSTMGYGHLTIEPAGYNTSPSLSRRLKNADDIRTRTLATPGVSDALVRITGQAMFASAAKSVGGMFFGVDPSAESPETNIFIRSMVKGAIFKSTDGRGIVIGAKMAEKLRLRLGKKLVYTTTDVNGEIVSELARVVGIFKTGVDAVDGSVALLPIDKTRVMLKFASGAATLVAVFIRDHRKAETMRRQLDQMVGSEKLEMLTWRETQTEVAGMVAVDRKMNHMSQFLVGLLISAGVLNTMLMSVLERKHEFAIMLAIGMAPIRLFALALTESFWLGALGLALGALITAPAYYYMSNTGLDLSFLMEQGADISGVLVDPVIKYRLYGGNVFAILSGVFAITALAGLYPAMRACRQKPVESLRTV